MPETSNPLPGVADAQRKLATFKRIARAYPYIAIAIALFVLGSVKSARVDQYRWVMDVHLRDLPDGTVMVAAPGDPVTGELAANLRVTLSTRNEGRWMTIGRVYSAQEEVVSLSPRRAAIHTATLRPAIASVLQRAIPAPTGSTVLTSQAEAAFKEAMAVYVADAGSKSVGRLPPWGEWLRLCAILIGAGIVVTLCFQRLQAMAYRSRGRERLALGQCPHCGNVLSGEVCCPDCGTDHALWATTLRVDPKRAVANAEDDIPAPPNAPAA